ncbi:hypothetical protein GWL_42490 [Herbaspirillum sp. GW103]|nr:hypothetical protein GWL_42490 [Herbaspirillum sp. GW103]
MHLEPIRGSVRLGSFIAFVIDLVCSFVRNVLPLMEYLKRSGVYHL